VLQSLSLFLCALAIVLFLCALAAGWIANSAPISPRKGRAKLYAYTSVGLAIIAFGIPILLYQAGEHPVPFAGTIVAAHATSGKSNHATLHIQLKNGCPLHLQADGTSPYFHPGQALQGQYASADGTLLAAKFLDGKGRQQGVFNGQMYYWIPWGILLVGAFILVSGWLLYRRDPLGANNNPRR
jgi:hypothetical protein